MKSIRNLILPLLAAGTLAMPAAMTSAVAQDKMQSPAVEKPEMQSPASDSASIDDNKLRSFAVAYLEVNKVAKSYKPRIESTSDPDEQEKLKTEASKGMVKAVEDAEGITVPEYESIMTSARSDPKIAKKINTYVLEAIKSDAESE